MASDVKRCSKALRLTEFELRAEKDDLYGCFLASRTMRKPLKSTNFAGLKGLDVIPLSVWQPMARLGLIQ